jgi:DNA topoisomerase-1
MFLHQLLEMEFALKTNIAVRWFRGFSLMEQTPDHSYFGKLRKRIGTERLVEIFEKTKGQKKAIVEKVERKQFSQMPPFPFDLTSLQVEAYRCFGIQPKETLEIAQELYTSGLMSYPRTSSQQLPPSIGYKKILNELEKNKEYRELIGHLLKTSKLSPNNGRKTDPAQPSMFPTGIMPEG